MNAPDEEEPTQPAGPYGEVHYSTADIGAEFDTLQLHPVGSTNVHAIAYNRFTRHLFVVFNTGRKYMFSGVPAHVFADYLTAESKGTYHWEMIRNKGADNLYPHTEF